MNEAEGIYEGEWYHWSCGACLEMNESEYDIRGMEQECTACGVKNSIEWSS